MFRSSLTITLLALCASALGFVVQLLLARRYGISVDVDAYLFALSVPTFIAALISSIISYELVPKLIACETDHDYQKRYISMIVIGVTCLSLFIGIVGSTLSVLQSKMLPNDSPIRLYENLTYMTILGWAICAIQIVNSCITAVLNAHRRYLDGAILALFPYIGMLMLLLTLEDAIGITALPLGLFAGTIVATLCGILLRLRHLFPIKFDYLLLPKLRQLALSSPLTAVAMTCFSSFAVIDAYWAPQAGQGTLAAIGYAQRLVIAFGGLAVAGPSVVLVPRFAELIREKNVAGFRRSLLRALIAVGSIVSGVAIAIAIYATELIELMFARGAFGLEEVGIVTQTLLCMLPGMVTMVMSAILLRAMFCLAGIGYIAAFLGISWTAAYFVASMTLYKFGAPGLAAGYSLVWILQFCILGIVIYRRTNKER